MPGIIGFAGHAPESPAGQFIQEMATALEPGGAYRVEIFQAEGFGLGRVSLGIANPHPQPVRNEDRSVCVVMEGELYDTAHLREGLVKRGCPLKTGDDAELVLYLYLEHGDQFPQHLNGAFVVAIWDARSNQLILINDRLGLYPLYYARLHDRFVFASGVRALLADPELDRKVDKAAVAQFLTFDHLLGDRTMLEAVRLMPQGVVMTIENGQVQITPYASLRYPKQYALRNEEEYREELVFLLRQAVRRQAQDSLTKGVLLSGGLDSRWILAILNEMPEKWPLHTFTWGIPGCDDSRYGRETAAATRAEHHFFELKPDYLLKSAEESVRLTDGMGNVINLHAIATLEDEVQFANVIYKGFLGDAMFGFALRPHHWADYDADTAIQAHLRVHEEQGVITFHPQAHATIFSDDFQKEVGSAVMDDYRDGMLGSQSSLLADQRLYFDLTQRVPRMTLKGVEVVRSKAHVRLPFCDPDLLDFSIRLPPGYRNDRQLVQNAFRQAFPGMSQIPISWTGLPLQSNARDLYLRGKRLVQWHLHARGLSQTQEMKWRPYKDYHNWFRTVLRPWVEDLLLSERFLQRGYFQPDAVRKIVAEHMQGNNQTVRLGAFLAIEIWHRMYID